VKKIEVLTHLQRKHKYVVQELADFYNLQLLIVKVKISLLNQNGPKAL